MCTLYFSAHLYREFRAGTQAATEQPTLKIIRLRIFSCSEEGSISLSVKTSHESSTWQTCEPKEGGKTVFTTKLLLDVLSICEDYSFAKL